MSLWSMRVSSFFFNDTATTEIYTLSLHDALPIFRLGDEVQAFLHPGEAVHQAGRGNAHLLARIALRSEEHTSELQSQSNLVCRLLLEKKNGSVSKRNHPISLAVEACSMPLCKGSA